MTKDQMDLLKRAVEESIMDAINGGYASDSFWNALSETLPDSIPVEEKKPGTFQD